MIETCLTSPQNFFKNRDRGGFRLSQLRYFASLFVIMIYLFILFIIVSDSISDMNSHLSVFISRFNDIILLHCISNISCIVFVVLA